MTAYALATTSPHNEVSCAETVQRGVTAHMLQTISQPGVELAIWQRPEWAYNAWLNALPVDALPTCRLTLQPDEAARTLHAVCDASGTPGHPGRDAWVADVAELIARFATLAGRAAVALRLDVLQHDGCRRWHRDCVPLRLLCTYRGPGTQWVPPDQAPAVMAQPDDDTPQTLSMTTGDVAVFKGCGWPGQPHDDGIVHRSPRIRGSGLTRLVLVLDLPTSSR